MTHFVRDWLNTNKARKELVDREKELMRFSTKQNESPRTLRRNHGKEVESEINRKMVIFAARTLLTQFLATATNHPSVVGREIDLNAYVTILKQLNSEASDSYKQEGGFYRVLDPSRQFTPTAVVGFDLSVDCFKHHWLKLGKNKTATRFHPQ